MTCANRGEEEVVYAHSVSKTEKKNQKTDSASIPWKTAGVGVPLSSTTLITTVVLDSFLTPSGSSLSDSYSSFSVGGSTSFPTADRNRDKKYPREKRYSCWTLHRELSRENIITARLASGRNSSRKLLSLLKVLSVRVRRWVTWSETTQIKLSAAEYELVSHVWTLIFKFHCRKWIWRPSLIL